MDTKPQTLPEIFPESVNTEPHDEELDLSPREKKLAEIQAKYDELMLPQEREDGKIVPCSLSQQMERDRLRKILNKAAKNRWFHIKG